MFHLIQLGIPLVLSYDCDVSFDLRSVKPENLSAAEGRRVWDARERYSFHFRSSEAVTGSQVLIVLS